MISAMKSIALFLLLVLSAPSSFAVVADLNLGIAQGGLAKSTDQNISRSINSMGIFANLGKSDATSGWLLGWYMSSVNNSDAFPGILNQTLTSSDMGPAFRWQTQARQIFSVTYAYGIICKGNFNDATVTEELNGESHLLKMGLETNLSDRFLIGFALNYYTANYKTSLVSSVQSGVSYKNTWTYPSISLSYRTF